MTERNVSATLFLDIPGVATTRGGAQAFATAFVDRFFREIWTFGPPRPTVYYDPRTAAPDPRGQVCMPSASSWTTNAPS